MVNNSSATYYQKNKARLQKSFAKGIKIYLKNEKNKKNGLEDEK